MFFLDCFDAPRLRIAMQCSTLYLQRIRVIIHSELRGNNDESSDSASDQNPASVNDTDPYKLIDSRFSVA